MALTKLRTAFSLRTYSRQLQQVTKIIYSPFRHPPTQLLPIAFFEHLHHSRYIHPSVPIHLNTQSEGQGRTDGFRDVVWCALETTPFRTLIPHLTVQPPISWVGLLDAGRDIRGEPAWAESADEEVGVLGLHLPRLSPRQPTEARLLPLPGFRPYDGPRDQLF